jgi:site-specific recombinase XerD
LITLELSAVPICSRAFAEEHSKQHSVGHISGRSGIHPHMLRHSCGFYLANRGYDLRLIQDYLGHRDPKHTVHYTRVAGNRFEGLWR